MIIRIEVPKPVFDSATNQLGGDDKAIEKRFKQEIARWAVEYRETLAKKNITIDKSDIDGFLDG